MTTMTASPGFAPSRIGAGHPAATIAGWLLTGVAGSLLLFDGLSLLLQTRSARDTWAQLGWRPEALVPIAIIQLVFLAVLLVPRTSVVGAILLTGHLGGVVAVRLAAGAPFLGELLLQAVVGLTIWAALCLRVPRLRSVLFGPPSP